jgi:hypothetical protein
VRRRLIVLPVGAAIAFGGAYAATRMRGEEHQPAAESSYWVTTRPDGATESCMNDGTTTWCIVSRVGEIRDSP